MDATTIEIGTKPPAALLELANSVRKLAATMIRIDSNESELRRVQAEVEVLTERLETIARKGSDPRILSSIEPGENDMRPYYPASAATWHCNPIFPPLDVEVEGNIVRGTLNLDLAYEGPPGCIHGGVVALIFDQLLGHANGANGTYGMTADLKVSYHRPTPLFRDLSFEAQVKHVDSRKITTEGAILLDGAPTASAVGLFIDPAFETSPLLPHISDDQVDQLLAHRELRNLSDDES